MGNNCCGSSKPTTVARPAVVVHDVSKASLVVIENPKLVAAERALHQNLSQQIRTTIARRDTAVINLQCIGSERQIIASGPNATSPAWDDRHGSGVDFTQVHLHERLPGEAQGSDRRNYARMTSGGVQRMSHGFAKVSSMMADAASPWYLYNASSMPVRLPDSGERLWTQSRNALQALIASEQRHQQEQLEQLHRQREEEERRAKEQAQAQQGQQEGAKTVASGQAAVGSSGDGVASDAEGGGGGTAVDAAPAGSTAPMPTSAAPAAMGNGGPALASRLGAGAGAGAGAGTGVSPFSSAKPAQSQEARLKERLSRLSLVMVTMCGDGNCQFRALANQLFGSQDHHAAVRNSVTRYIRLHKEEFSAFLGEDFDCYVDAMSRNGTWGDELTLRAACDRYGSVIRCITSEESNWYISYEPLKVRSNRELFLAYISPIHYNALRRSEALQKMVRNISNRFTHQSNKAAAHRSRQSLEPFASAPPAVTGLDAALRRQSGGGVGRDPNLDLSQATLATPAANTGKSAGSAASPQPQQLQPPESQEEAAGQSPPPARHAQALQQPQAPARETLAPDALHRVADDAVALEELQPPSGHLAAPEHPRLPTDSSPAPQQQQSPTSRPLGSEQSHLSMHDPAALEQPSAANSPVEAGQPPPPAGTPLASGTGGQSAVAPASSASAVAAPAVVGGTADAVPTAGLAHVAAAAAPTMAVSLEPATVNRDPETLAPATRPSTTASDTATLATPAASPSSGPAPPLATTAVAPALVLRVPDAPAQALTQAVDLAADPTMPAEGSALQQLQQAKMALHMAGNGTAASVSSSHGHKATDQ